jgi:hypothetical protein
VSRKFLVGQMKQRSESRSWESFYLKAHHCLNALF